MTLRIKKDDLVVVRSGKDAGKKGKVLTVFSKDKRAIVERINLAKKHLRKRKEDQQSGIVEVETPVHISNLRLFCKQCNGPASFKTMVLEDKTKSRTCKKCGEAL